MTGVGSARDALIAAFLARHGYDPADAEPLAQDASFRRYLRVRGTRPAVLMDAPPPEDVGAFLRIAAHWRTLGLSVPAILHADPATGLVLEEDLGDDVIAALLDRGEPADALLDAAVDALAALHRAEPPPWLPAWGPAEMIQTASATVFDWWWPARHGRPAPEAARNDVTTALRDMLAPLGGGPRAMVHRDYFAGNLLWLPERRGVARVGILDFQSAAVGHPAYDLASLVQDARRAIAPDLRERALARYLAARPGLDPARFRDAYDACAAQRHLRVAGQWTRLALRDGRPQYLRFGPQTWQLLADALRRPAARALREALNRWIPLPDRGNPPPRRDGNASEGLER